MRRHVPIALALAWIVGCGSDDSPSSSSPDTPDGSVSGAHDAGGDVISGNDASKPDAGDDDADLDASTQPDVPAPTGPLNEVTYTLDATTVLTNPERGFYHHLETTPGSYDALDANSLKAYRNDGISHILRVFYLDGLTASPIPASYLTSMRADFKAVRDAGLTAIIRFAYTTDEAGNDATPAQVLSHIDQFAPVLKDNEDIIEVVQAGFVGAWGEWYYTTHFGNTGTLSSADWAARKSVVDKLLGVTSRPVQLRTPAYKRTMYGATTLTDATAYSNSNTSSRVGFHDDCFVADDQDEGTFQDPADSPFMAADSRYVPVGGETCAYNAPRSACPSALADMQKYHYSFLNIDYEPSVISHWKTDGCYATMQQKLGYRLALVSGKYSKTAQSGGSMHVEMVIQNDGYGSIVNPKALAISLHNSGGGTTRIPLNADARRWGPGQSTVSQDIAVGGLAPGDYEVWLSLGPVEASLTGRPEYQVRFANSGAAGAWDATTGLTNLGTTLTITP